MKNEYSAVIIIGIAIAAAAGFLYFRQESGGELDNFAQCLRDKGITMYGADWCAHCQNEKKAFGNSFKHVPYIECPDNPKQCLDAGIKGYPTWVFPDGKKLEGEQGIEKLSQESGCPLEKQKPETEATGKGFILPVVWGDLGLKLVESGVIDRKKFEEIYSSRGGLTEEVVGLLDGSDDGKLKITAESSGVILNLLWALGLANKNEILEKGPMADPQFGGPGVFASTGGWTLAEGDTMSHYSAHEFVKLTPDQQRLVEKVSKNIYRPCCNNPTYFPDCNHGMAMLGFLELMASQNASEEDMYKFALAVNSYWFPDTYLTIAEFLQGRGIKWEETNPKEILGVNFSSAWGYQQILSQVAPPQDKGGGSCGV